ncbi:MAG: hypothetical protein KGY45_03980 [Hadesarchaea archaeon]|nr:hypothetical protein [Hadesarchaea archaeon]
MKIAIQGLGEVPTPVELVLDKEKPDKSYIVASEYQLNYVCERQGHEESNEEVIKAAAKEAGTELEIRKCDAFDLDEITDTVADILEEISEEADEVLVNYTGGSANVRVILGLTGIVLTRVCPTKIMYAINYPEGPDVMDNQAEKLRDIYLRLNELF